MTTLVSRTICARHGFKATVGRNVQYALDYYECPTCVAIADREYREQQEREWIRAEAAALRGHPSICLCPACAPGEAEYYRMLEEEAERMRVAEILSPNYCNHQENDWGFCLMSDCRHAACNAEPPF